jgi:hypothetical protein
MPDQPSTVNVPLPQYIADAAHAAGLAAAQAVIDRHVATCEAPGACKQLARDVLSVRIGLAKLTGLLVGSGALGASLVKYVFP